MYLAVRVANLVGVEQSDRVAMEAIYGAVIAATQFEQLLFTQQLQQYVSTTAISGSRDLAAYVVFIDLMRRTSRPMGANMPPEDTNPVPNTSAIEFNDTDTV